MPLHPWQGILKFYFFCILSSTQLIWLTIQVIGFLLLNMHLHVCWLHFIINSRTILEQSVSSFISKNSALFELLESFLTTKSSKGLRASQLACRVSIIPNIYVHLSPVSAFYVFFWLIEFVVFPGLGFVFFSKQRWLFRKATLASTELEALGTLQMNPFSKSSGSFVNIN